MRGNWQRVSRRRPCPVCGRPDWCLVTGDCERPSAAICARTESPKRCGEAGWLHALRSDGPTRVPWRRSIGVAQDMVQRQVVPADWAKAADDFSRALPAEALQRLAASLGVSIDSLRRLQAGWSAAHRAFSFPMRDPMGEVLGIRLRTPQGRKRSVRGGREGLFVPEGLLPEAPAAESAGADKRLIICEGPTDCAALLDLGLWAVGRPSCSGGVRLLVDLVRGRGASEVVIMADGDPPGQRGAESLAPVLGAYAAAVRVVLPPCGIKDAREWVRRGAKQADVYSAIEAAPLRHLSIHTRVRKAGAAHAK